MGSLSLLLLRLLLRLLLFVFLKAQLRRGREKESCFLFQETFALKFSLHESPTDDRGEIISMLLSIVSCQLAG